MKNLLKKIYSFILTNRNLDYGESKDFTDNSTITHYVLTTTQQLYMTCREPSFHSHTIMEGPVSQTGAL